MYIHTSIRRDFTFTFRNECTMATVFDTVTPNPRFHHGGETDSISPLELGAHSSKTAPSTPASRSTPGTRVASWGEAVHDVDPASVAAR